jgi:hypothetical protein
VVDRVAVNFPTKQDFTLLGKDVRNKSLHQKVGTITNEGVKIISYGKTFKGQRRNLFSVECINCGHKWREESHKVDKAFCSPCRRNPESDDF